MCYEAQPPTPNNFRERASSSRYTLDFFGRFFGGGKVIRLSLITFPPPNRPKKVRVSRLDDARSRKLLGVRGCPS